MESRKNLLWIRKNTESIYMKICNFCTVIVIIVIHSIIFHWNFTQKVVKNSNYFTFNYSHMFKRIFNWIKYSIKVNEWCWSNAINANWNAKSGKWHRFWFHFRKVCDEMSEIFNGETFSTTFRDTDFHPNKNFQIPTMLDNVRFYVSTKCQFNSLYYTLIPNSINLTRFLIFNK